ncbi:hypothetical protein JCM14244_00250 [Venenivibrio stagnispumantis]|uniref:Glycine cleavage system H protein n=1 Tax=Venenivibrio stagnispumantis TaxID=407998 RepID=A0AA45WN35_9AQUI|nr:glycine cleavage system protein GcvH [Venenivibrio stagnispumantis]MCW4573576.1 glycine cleavage system protein GcvH [Venenivibrio stagnispumantis]SMP16580.1 glycine cleavage system H protein [Venenivibrio stagnispumantis]
MQEYNVVEGLYYTKEHVWVKIEDDLATIGITDYGQHQLGDIVFVDLPEKDADVESGDVIASVESVKAVSEVYSPLTGKIIEVNEELNNDPGLINRDPYGDGWIAQIKMSDPTEIEDLMTDEDYKAYLEEIEKEEEEL